MYIQLILHFVITQCQALWIFYIGLQSHLANLAYWSFTHTSWKVESESNQRNFTAASVQEIKPLGRYLDCMLGSSYTMLFDFSSDYEAHCVGLVGSAWSDYGLPMGVNQAFASFNVVGLLIVVIFVVVLLAGLVTSKVKDFGDATYLAYTFRMKQSTPYKVMSTLIVILAALLLAVTLRFLVAIHNSAPGVFVNFILYLLPTIFALLYSAITLAKASKHPFFDYESDNFLDIVFKRSWSSVLVDNTAFAGQLETALVKAKYGDTKDLEDLLPEDADIQTVIRACTPEENSDSSDDTHCSS
jgi:hypothetical protein